MNSIAQGNKRIAVVHATGTGKSYIIAAVTNHFNRVLVIAPNRFVLNETQKVCGHHVEFCTYAALMHNKNPHTDYDMIVLDEFHRSGAEKWGAGCLRLIEANPQAVVFGISATHIRYLDNNRNMADELFDGNVVSHLSLNDALERGILPTPTYVCSAYAIDKTVRDLSAKIAHSAKKNIDKQKLQRHLYGIARNWENACGVPVIIRKYFSHDMQRIIVFCSKVARAAAARKLLSGWFGMAGFKRVRYYNIDYRETRLEREMQDFQSPLGDYDLKVAISVNMLNEGVHIPHVDGIIMLRSTISRIILEQQIGRCLTADSKGKVPVVLDLVNNMDLIRYNEIQFTGMFDDTGKGTSDDSRVEKYDFPFHVIDMCKDIRILLGQLNEQISTPYGHWTKERVHEEALKCKTRNEFRIKHSRAYHIARFHGWINEVCSHMEVIVEYWTKEQVQQEALKYKTRTDFKRNHPGAYCYAWKHGLLDEVCAHMDIKIKRWTKEQVRREALKYKTRTAFDKGSHSAYVSAIHHGWLDELCSHMKVKKIHWTKELMYEEIKKCTTLKEFRIKHSRAYDFARLHGLLDEVRSCFNAKKRTHWSKEMVHEKALGCKTRNEFRTKCTCAYDAALRHGWLDEVCSHMKPKRHTPASS